MGSEISYIVGINGLNKSDKKNKLKRKIAFNNQNKLIDMIYSHLGYKSNGLKRFLIRSVIYCTASKGRVKGYAKMNAKENEIFYKYFPIELLTKLYPDD